MSDQLLQALVVVVVNVIGYAAVRRELVAIRRQHQTVIDDHERRITRLEHAA